MSQHVMNVKVGKKPRLVLVLIMFTYVDEMGVKYPCDNVLVVTLKVDLDKINRILMDTGNLVDITFKETLYSLNIENLKMGPVDTTIYDFADSYILS